MNIILFTAVLLLISYIDIFIFMEYSNFCIYCYFVYYVGTYKFSFVPYKFKLCIQHNILHNHLWLILNMVYAVKLVCTTVLVWATCTLLELKKFQFFYVAQKGLSFIFSPRQDPFFCNFFCLIKLLARAFLKQNSLHVKRMVKGI